MKLWLGMACVAPDTLLNGTTESAQSLHGEPVLVEADVAPLRRCVIVEMPDAEQRASEGLDCDVRVRFVDQGYTAWVAVRHLHALPQRFSRHTPVTAVHCRLADVVRDDLYQHKLVAFRQSLTPVRHIARVQLVNNIRDVNDGVFVTDRPYIVNLFHPTERDLNMGAQFYKPLKAPPATNRQDPPCIVSDWKLCITRVLLQRIARGEDPEAELF